VQSAHFKKGVKCVDCHSNHRILHPTFAIYSSRDKGGCLSCHPDPNSKEDKYIMDVKDVLEQSNLKMKDAETDIANAGDNGLETAPQEELLQNAKTGMIKFVSVQHQLSLTAIKNVTTTDTDSNADRIQDEISQMFKTVTDRKIFTTAFAAYVFIFMLILYIKYRTLLRKFMRDLQNRK